MANAPERNPSRWLESLGRNPGRVAQALLGLGCVFTVLAVLLVVWFHYDAVVEVIGCFAFAFVLMACGLWLRSREPGGLSDVDATRLLTLIVGGCLGLFLTLMAVTRAYNWREFLAGGTEAWQGPQSWRLWVCVLTGLVGLAVMFLSLQLARTEERSNAVLRRLLYGYNAVLTGLLVLAILVIVNVLAYLYVPLISDWTKNGLYTLSPQAKNTLQNLEQPLSIYVILPERQAADEVQTLLDQCQALSSKLSVEYLSVHHEPQRIQDLLHKYPPVGDPAAGMLLVYGVAPQQSYQYLRDDGELFEQERDGSGYKFKGEDSLLSAIRFLAEGKSKPVVYFTQGNGELSIEDSRSRRGLFGGQQQSASELRQALQRANYDVKGLKIDPLVAPKPASTSTTVEANRVPDDAAAVVIAGPRQALPEPTLTALKDYMKKNGKLIVMLDVVTKDGRMVHTGLEDLLREYNVKVPEERVFTLEEVTQVQQGQVLQGIRYPGLIHAAPSAAQGSMSPLASAFQESQFKMIDGRPVEPATTGQPGKYRVDELLRTRDQTVWAEKDLETPPFELVRNLYQAGREQIIAKRNKQGIPVAVTVSESGPSSTPRLVVFGDAAMVSNGLLDNDSTSLLTSSLAWLREKPSSIGIEAKKRERYQMDKGTNVSRMVNLPFMLMSLGVIGLGLGVWVTRRR